MKKYLSIIILFTFSTTLPAQKAANQRFILGSNIGASCAYADLAFNFALTGSITLDYHLKNGYYLQLAPRYSWLWRWNEHYLTVPLHLRKQLNDHLSVYAGPAMSWDIGYFRDLGFSGGINLHITRKSAIQLFVFTFSLKDYEIDYWYVPVGVAYQISW